MFSVKPNLRAITPRLVLWTTLSSAICLFLATTTVYYLLSTSLRKNDQQLITSIAREYGEGIRLEGVKFLTRKHTPEFLVSLADNKGKILYLTPPEYLDRDFEDDDEIEQIQRAVKVMPLKKGWHTILLLSGEEDMDVFHQLEHWLRKTAWKNDWTSILPLIDNDMVEVYTEKISDDLWLRVGRSSEDREEHLARIRYISLIVLLPFVFIILIISFFLSRTILSPIRALSETIRDIRAGNPSRRAPVTGSGDEIDHLAEEFNSLLDHNQKLISNMKETIDNVAHDLRTPLTRFRAGMEQALMKKTDLSELKSAIGEGLEETQEILSLLNSILDVAEAETGTLRLHTEKLSLKPLLEDLKEMFLYTAEEKNLRLLLNAESDVTVMGDRIRLMQALGNILENAIKYSPPNKNITLSLRTTKTEAIIEISDEGPGIPPEIQDRIWERLYRADKSRSTPGLGIGLSVVKAIVTAHGGQVSLRSQSDQGATFILTLPICHHHVM